MRRTKPWFALLEAATGVVHWHDGIAWSYFTACERGDVRYPRPAFERTKQAVTCLWCSVGAVVTESPFAGRP